ncbi:MAG: RNA polymerase sigma-54 factor [Planctomycetaceae bacterium]|nr:MAG: RNA polymerase sigma-54 factor [Planctomycetaceae bacterium]
MRLDASQHIRLEQSMKLSPRIIQAMEILQLPLMALQERIDAEMESNPVLEMHDDTDDDTVESPDIDREHGEQPLVVKEASNNIDDFERLSDYENEYGAEQLHEAAPPRAAADTGERDRKLDAMANAPAPAQSLDEYLLDQWAFVEADDAVKSAGRLIIGRIEEDGYLRASLEDLAGETSPPTDIAVLESALCLVQGLDPLGIGARDLKECLLLQLNAQESAGRDVSLEKLLVERFLRDIEMNHLPAIARRTNKSIEQIKAALEVISRLNPRPGYLVGQRIAPTITPDVIVTLGDDGGIVVSMPDGNTPPLYISKMYQRLARDRQAPREARQFLQRNIRSAQWLIGAIQQRRHTVLRVTEEVFKMQKEFLVEGPEALRPLPMSDIAAKVGVHVATVSRAVAGKYVQTPVGIFPLRMFFSGGKISADGENMAWNAIKVHMKELVDNEDKKNPLQDDELAAQLSRDGITIARRTVAKYRDLLDIPPARKRRIF